MKKLQYQISINAPASTVYNMMLGISDIKNYEEWTSIFNPTSTYKGNWEKGSKILFLGTDEQGQQGGMLSRIAEHRLHEFVSIQHYGLINAGEEITSGPDVEKWANGYENYTFEEKNGSTLVRVDLDTSDDFVDYMNEKYPNALQKLKHICER